MLNINMWVKFGSTGFHVYLGVPLASVYPSRVSDPGVKCERVEGRPVLCLYQTQDPLFP